MLINVYPSHPSGEISKIILTLYCISLSHLINKLTNPLFNLLTRVLQANLEGERGAKYVFSPTFLI